MRRLWAAAVLAALIAGVCLWGGGRIAAGVERMERRLDECEAAAKTGRAEEMHQALAAASEQWQSERRALMTIARQELLDEVDDQLSYMNALIDWHKEEFVPALTLCRAALEEMKQMELPSASSFF